MGFTKKKITRVGVSVTIDNRMEAVVLDIDNKTVVEYRTTPLEYNFQTKEIANYEAFSTALKTMLFDEMGLNAKNLDLTLTVPNILFSSTQVRAEADDSEVDSVCGMAAQESYLFKRHEPLIASQKYPAIPGKEETTAIYSAIQESVADQLRNAILSTGIENFSINNPYGSIINGLNYLGQIEKQVNSNERWNFVQITDTGFTLFSMIGTKIIEINEMPLPLKTFAPEEIYETMALSLQTNLSIYPASSLFVLSKTDLLSAKLLLQRMELRWEVGYLDNNRYATEPIIKISDNVDSDFAKIISVEAIGSAITDKTSPFNLQYLTNKDQEELVVGYIKLFGQDIPINETFIKNCCMGAAGTIAIAGLLLYFGINGINGLVESSINKLENQKTEIEQQISKAKGETEGNVENIIADISKYNQSTITYFDAISKEIPADLWLTYYYSDSLGAFAVKGDTADVNSVYEFYKGIKSSVPEIAVTLSKLQYNDIDAVLNTGAQGNKSLNFEITNAAYTNAQSMMAAKQNEGEAAAQPNGNTNVPQPPQPNNNNSNNNNEFDENGFPTLPTSGLKPPTE